MKDLFGNEIIEDVLLRDKYIEPPFSVLDTKQGSWRKRKRAWIDIGIKSELGRNNNVLGNSNSADHLKTGCSTFAPNTSIFDPALCKIIYHWFCPLGGTILDPFAGGSVRGIVANYLKYSYLGIDIRSEQIKSNEKQAAEIIPSRLPLWISGDSNKELDKIEHYDFDFVFSCPPYANLEKYSDLDGDISNMSYSDFLESYRSIIKKSISHLKTGGYACFVVGEVRDKKTGEYLGFVPDTIQAFKDAGAAYYNECILLNNLGTAAMRAGGCMKKQKLVKVHQNILVFKKQE